MKETVVVDHIPGCSARVTCDRPDRLKPKADESTRRTYTGEPVGTVPVLNTSIINFRAPSSITSGNDTCFMSSCDKIITSNQLNISGCSEHTGLFYVPQTYRLAGPVGETSRCFGSLSAKI
jgi:hypothetical protein